MKISLNHIRSLGAQYKWSDDPASEGVDVLVSKIGAQLGAVEEVVPVGKRYEGAVIVRVVTCNDHPDADRLHVCTIDDGNKVPGVTRGDKGLIQVVCGAPNVHAGMLAVWLPPKTVVPNSYDSDPFTLEARAIRGVTSNGMLASSRELALTDEHEGILEIDDPAIVPGTPFAEAFGLKDDVVIDMENKMFTHRPDCFGVMGIARELAGIQNQPFESPSWYRHDVAFDGTADQVKGSLRVEVKNELSKLVPRFVAVPIGGVSVKASPVWLQVNLSRLGIRPINNVVDLTNYYMVLTGQPLHAYDYDKLVAQDAGADHATLVVRQPKAGEKILLLNGKEVEPRPETIMIATNDKLVGIGGVMGGGDTEVDDTTKNIILECANFDMYSIRRTSMAHGLFTDAVARFNKGQSPLQNAAVAKQAAEDIVALAGGTVAGNIVDDNRLDERSVGRGSVHEPVSVSRTFITARLGFDLPVDTIAALLRNVEFVIDVTDDNLKVKAPFWRTDIAIPEDIVEEVGRLYGFDHLPLSLPKRDLTAAVKDDRLELKAELRNVLSRAGANEVLTYSFVHGNLFDKVGQESSRAFRIGNALSPDLQYYRMSLLPSLLEKVHPNMKAGYDAFALFELNKTYDKQNVGEDKLPKEFESLALVVGENDKRRQDKPGTAYFQAKRYLEFLAASLGISLSYAPFAEEPEDPVTRPFDYRRSALVTVRENGAVLGVVGEFRPAVGKALKLPRYAAGFEIGTDELLSARKVGHGYAVLPRFPKVEQDICLRLPVEVPYQELEEFLETTLSERRPEETTFGISPVDIYQRDETSKQTTFRLTIASYARTLTDQEVNALLEQVAAAAKDKYGAERV